MRSTLKLISIYLVPKKHVVPALVPESYDCRQDSLQLSVQDVQVSLSQIYPKAVELALEVAASMNLAITRISRSGISITLESI